MLQCPSVHIDINPLNNCQETQEISMSEFSIFQYVPIELRADLDKYVRVSTVLWYLPCKLQFNLFGVATLTLYMFPSLTDWCSILPWQRV